jgi:hypothetical protein
VWVSVWDDAGHRDAFVEAVRGGLDRLSRPSSLNEEELLGRPGAVLRVGVSPETPVRVWEGEAR